MTKPKATTLSRNQKDMLHLIECGTRRHADGAIVQYWVPRRGTEPVTTPGGHALEIYVDQSTYERTCTSLVARGLARREKFGWSITEDGLVAAQALDVSLNARANGGAT